MREVLGGFETRGLVSLVVWRRGRRTRQSPRHLPRHLVASHRILLGLAMTVVMVAMVAMVVMVEVMINDDDNSQIKNLLELIEGRVLLSGAIPLALLGRC